MIGIVDGCSLKSMFNSIQFEGALANFQHLLSEGMFETSEPSLSPRVLQHYRQVVTVTDLTGSGWMERCVQLQNRKKRRGSVDYTKVFDLADIYGLWPLIFCCPFCGWDASTESVFR